MRKRGVSPPTLSCVLCVWGGAGVKISRPVHVKAVHLCTFHPHELMLANSLAQGGCGMLCGAAGGGGPWRAGGAVGAGSALLTPDMESETRATCPKSRRKGRGAFDALDTTWYVSARWKSIRGCSEVSGTGRSALPWCPPRPPYTINTTSWKIIQTS